MRHGQLSAIRDFATAVVCRLRENFSAWKFLELYFLTRTNVHAGAMPKIGIAAV
jgi:hypothetical protein